MKNQINILLADDDQDDCLLFREALRELQFSTQLTMVHDGVQLIKYLSENSAALPDVLFLDLNMPRLSGFEFMEQFKQKENHILPVIICSTSYAEHIADDLFEKGAYYYMRKPTDFAQFMQLLDQALSTITENLPAIRAGNFIQPLKDFFLLTGSKKIIPDGE